MTNPPGGTPVIYEDRTLFPTPIAQPQSDSVPPRTGLSTGGVMLVAVFAAAIAAAVVYFLMPIINAGDERPAPVQPVAQQPCVPLNTISVNSDTSQFCTLAEWAKYKERSDAQIRQREEEALATLRQYQTLSDAELERDTQLASVKAAIEEAKAANIGGRTLEIFETMPEGPDPDWKLKTENEIRQYAKTLENKAKAIRNDIEKIKLARARNEGIASVDLETCDTPGGC